MPLVGPGLAFVPVTLVGYVATLTDVPNAVTEVLLQRVKMDLAPFTEVSLAASIVTTSASVNSPRVYLQYSLDESTWSTLTAQTVSLAVFGAKRTAWETIPAAARADVFVRLVSNGGDGVADPVIGSTIANFR